MFEISIKFVRAACFSIIYFLHFQIVQYLFPTPRFHLKGLRQAHRAPQHRVLHLGFHGFTIHQSSVRGNCEVFTVLRTATQHGVPLARVRRRVSNGVCLSYVFVLGCFLGLTEQEERGFVLKIYLKGMEGERVTTCNVDRSFAICLDGLCLEYVGIFSLAKNDGTVGP